MTRNAMALVLALLVMGDRRVGAQEAPANAGLREALNDMRSFVPLDAEKTQERNVDDVYARLMGISRGTSINVELRDETELQGRLGEVTEKDFRLLLESGDWRTLEIDEVVRIWIPPQVEVAVAPDPTGGWGNKKSNILAAIVAGALAGLLLVALYR